MKRRAFLAIGSNLGDRWMYLQLAIDSLPDVVAVSPIYETEPVGGPDEQGAYLNGVLELRTDKSPHELLAAAHEVERAAGRVRAERFGPRTLDVDVLWIDGVEMQTNDLEVPHPRMWERRFVLQPLGDVAPDLLPEGWEEQAIGEVWQAGSLGRREDPSDGKGSA
jgi:2-amino-4-hydroxy-6-hydroxymethyldihydropteridine diphosphokinase